MNEDEATRRAENLIDILQIKFHRRDSNAIFSEPRAFTAWGSKTRKGLIATIKRIMYEKEE